MPEADHYGDSLNAGFERGLAPIAETGRHQEGSTARIPGRISDIEFLRAVAVVLVLYEHMPINLVFWPSRTLNALGSVCRGWVGVDLFFAISGFVIARGLLPAIARTGTLEEFLAVAFRFWIRRAWRLLPTAWVWLVIPLGLSIFWNRSGIFSDPLTNFGAMIAGMLDVANFRMGHLFGLKPYGATFPYWSLSLEEQFYLLLPVAVFIFRSWLPGLMLALVVLQFAETTTPMSMMVRCGAISVGVLLAICETTPLYRALEPTALAKHGMLRSVAVLVLVVVLTALGSDAMFISQSRLGLIAIVSGVLVWIGSYGRNYLCPQGRLGTIALWLGARSYAVYVIHIPVYFSLRELWARLNGAAEPSRMGAILYIAAAIGVIGLLAWANDRFYADRLRRRGAIMADELFLHRIA